MHGPDAMQLRAALESVREELVAAVHAWRAAGKADDDLALVVDGRHPGKPTISTADRKELLLTIADFDPALPIDFAQGVPGQAPAAVDLKDLVRRVVWIDLTPPYTW